MNRPLSPTADIQDAQYTLAALKAYQGNPLIEALPNYLGLSRQALADKLYEMPDEKDITAKPTMVRAEYLTTICSDFFVPSSQHQELFLMIDLLLRHGYRHRNPRLPLGLQYHEEALERFKAIQADKSWQDPLSICVIGCPGTGKTSSVERVLQLYPKVIRHNKLWTGTELLQVVHLRVECPEDGSVKSLCCNVIRQLGEIVGCEYEAQFCKSRSTLNSLKMALIRLLNIHCVGTLVIDEMQNIVNSRKDREELFNFLVSLSNSLKVPLIFIGTYKLQPFMQTTMRSARRTGSMGSFTWNPISRKSSHWSNLTAALWKAAALRDLEDEMPEAVSDALYDLSQGVTDIVVKLFILTQLRVLALTSERMMPERITPGLLRKVYEDHFSHIRPFTDALRVKDFGRIDSFGDIKEKDDKAFAAAARSMLDSLRESAATEDAEQLEEKELLHVKESLETMSRDDLARVMEVLLEKSRIPGVENALAKAIEELKKQGSMPTGGNSRIADASKAAPIVAESLGEIQQ